MPHPSDSQPAFPPVGREHVKRGLTRDLAEDFMVSWVRSQSKVSYSSRIGIIKRTMESCIPFTLLILAKVVDLDEVDLHDPGHWYATIEDLGS